MKNGRLRPWTMLSVLLPALALLVAALTPRTAAAQQGGEAEDQEKAMHYSLYYENFKNGNYEAALPELRWILANAPTYPRNDDRNYERMVEAFVGMAEKASGDQKKAYLDSALAYIEKAVPELEEAGAEVDLYAWKLEKGRFLQSHSEVYPDRQEESFDAYREAFELAPKEIDAYYIERLILNYLQADKKEEAISFMDEIETERPDDEKVTELLAQYRNRVFTSPGERITFLEKRLDQNPDDTEIMTELFDLYVQEGQSDKASRLASRLMEEDPSPRVYRTVAKMRLEDGDAQEAFEMYEKSIEMDEEEPSAQVYYNMGLAQQQMGQLAQARNYFRQAVEADESFGEAYLAIGDLYANAVSQCGGEELSREDRAVYWLATDYYQKAKNANPSLESAANQKIGTYRQYYPNQEALFFKGWEPGQSYRVSGGCYSWINETTTVKSPSS